MLIDNLRTQELVDCMYQHLYDPHLYLGLHQKDVNEKVIRLWRPGAENVSIELFGSITPLNRIDERGLFELTVPLDTNPTNYRVYHQNGLLAHDPYTFLPTIGDIDQYLFAKGVHYQIYDILGAKPMQHQGVEGVRFAVWAPGAKEVSLVADFNYWDGRVNPMRTLGHSGIWELFVPGLKEGLKYKFEVRGQTGQLKVKSDPYAVSSELRPATASIVSNIDKFSWTDHTWIEKRASTYFGKRPINIYEVHLGSWKRRHGSFLNYREIAVELATYCQEMGYNYVELLPIQEHPLDESWGYQVSGFYSPTSRFGSLEDFQWFVNHLHSFQIGIILDWVPGHFPTDDFSLSRFDGTALYEHEDPKQAVHPHWGTLIFNFGRHEVENFLIGNALYWFEKMHVDGLRVDAVASMLYLDYGREHGDWIPNPYGGKENLDAIEFFKHLNSIVHQKCPGVLMIAEESTAFTGITHAVESGGLGFDMKWNMGWMHDTLRYFSKDMIFRCYHHNDLTFGLLYAFTERFLLALSHDEVVHGKGSLLSKMPGDMWQKFANLRLLLSYQICQPGKKLLFMGGEIGQWNEWWCKGEIEFFLLGYSTHQGLHLMVKELNHFYLNTPALYEKDFEPEGFSWVDFSDVENGVISYLRKSDKQHLLCVHHTTPSYHEHYKIALGNVAAIQEVFNSDQAKYGGSGKYNEHVTIENGSIRIKMPPIATMIFEVFFH